MLRALVDPIPCHCGCGNPQEIHRTGRRDCGRIGPGRAYWARMRFSVRWLGAGAASSSIGRAMGSPALRQADLFPDAVEVWTDRLLAAFADASARSRLLPLAEQAVAACPADRGLLLLAAAAAVLDKRPDRALGLLDRLSKSRKALAAHLLYALALIQLHRTDAAKALLIQHGLTNLRAALSV